MGIIISRKGTAYLKLRMARNRAIIARKRLKHVDPTTYIHWTSQVSKDLVTGPYVFMGRNCNISPLVVIGRYTMLASNVAIVGDDHNWNSEGVPMQFAGRPMQHTTNIGADAWLGHGVIVMRGSTIGDGAIIAAGAVVTKEVPPYEIWAGAPAKRIRDRFADESQRARHAVIIAGPLLLPNFVQPREEYPRVTN